eukprot:104196-Amorphochlora_amoeboformis.AAC.1
MSGRDDSTCAPISSTAATLPTPIIVKPHEHMVASPPFRDESDSAIPRIGSTVQGNVCETPRPRDTYQ